MQMESVIVTKCEQLLLKAIHFGASDIHIVPSAQHYTILFRKYNQLIFADEQPTELTIRMISYFKYLSMLDISEKRKPQSGAFQETFEDGQFAFRVSTLPSTYQKESVVVRILKQNTAVPLEELCLSEERVQQLKSLVSVEQGLLLFTGPTGSGKTTSLYSIIRYCSEQLHRHVISLEDPVERTQQRILQIQVNEKAGVSYASGLRAILRHSPDVIMIGEIRDEETAHIAVEAALTGHLVVSTVHAKNTVNCLYRLMDLNISFEQLRQTVIGIAAQRLVTLPNEQIKAVMELLHGAMLREAFQSIQRNEQYYVPAQESLTNQLRYWRERDAYRTHQAES